MFAHTANGGVPPGYWWIEGRFARPTDAEFLLVPSLRVVYVPVGDAFVAYDAGIAEAALARSGTDGTRSDFLDRTGRVADKPERVELARRLALVLETRHDVERLIAYGRYYEALDRMRHLNEGEFSPKSHERAVEAVEAAGAAGAAGIKDRIVRVLRLHDYVDLFVVGVALALLLSTVGASGVTAMGLVSRLVDCIGASIYGNRSPVTALISFVVPLVTGAYPRIAEILTQNRTLACALSVALSVLSVTHESMFVGLASSVSSLTVESSIGCIGELGGESVRMRQTGEIIASVVLVLVHITDGSANAEAATISADAFERLIVAQFGTCLVPKSMLSMIVAIARTGSSASALFDEYLASMTKMGSTTHRFAKCLLSKPHAFGADTQKKRRERKNERKNEGKKERKKERKKVRRLEKKSRRPLSKKRVKEKEARHEEEDPKTGLPKK